MVDGAPLGALYGAKEDGGSQAILLALIGMTFAFGQLLTNASLSISSVALTNAIKSTEPFVALIYGTLVLQKAIPRKAVVFMTCVMFGAIITSRTDDSFSSNGVMYAALSNIIFQTRNVMIKGYRSNYNSFKDISLFLLSNTIGMAILLIALLTNGYDYNLVNKINVNCLLTLNF